MSQELDRRLRELGLLQGRGAVRELARCCHSGRLVGGLSVSLQALPDEVLGALTHAMGGSAKTLKVVDVRGTHPMMLEVSLQGVVERWEVEGVDGLIHNLNDLFLQARDVKAIAVLGEWEDMLQVWCLDDVSLSALLAARVLDDARNVAVLRRRAEADDS